MPFKLKDEEPIESIRSVSLPLWEEDYAVLREYARKHGSSFSELARQVLDRAIEDNGTRLARVDATFWYSRDRYAQLMKDVPHNMRVRYVADLLSRVAREIREPKDS